MIKINLSKILRYSLIVLLNVLCILIIQYYLNTQKNLADSISNLQVTIFVNNSIEKTSEEILEQLSNNKFSVVDIYDLQSKEKFLDITPELENIVNNDFMTFPKFVVVNNLSVNSVEEIEQLKEEILQLDFVEDFVYDKKAYKMFLDKVNLLNSYEKFFYYSFIFICVIFILKLVFYILKYFYNDILFEVVGGLVLGILSYILVSLIVPLFSQGLILILNWKVLYIVVPLSFMTTLLTKESNV